MAAASLTRDRSADAHEAPKPRPRGQAGVLLARLSVHESVDDLCKKAASLWAGREMLGIAEAARAHARTVTWENTIPTLCTKGKPTLST